ncbi:hypothetical protein SDC9_80292 [bioreactor metagenome]|uniref:Uncharacterized protein n=1 Tax=bioreactor metagenome TaxID=1076179 RepID=A0A644Z6J9_9ZZZZ
MGEASSCLLNILLLIRLWLSLLTWKFSFTNLCALNAFIILIPEIASSKWLTMRPIMLWVSFAPLLSFRVIRPITSADTGRVSKVTIVS